MSIWRSGRTLETLRAIPPASVLAMQAKVLAARTRSAYTTTTCGACEDAAPEACEDAAFAIATGVQNALRSF